MKYNNIKCTFIGCLYWLASLLVVGNFAYAQTELEASAPVEILMADPVLTSPSITSTLFEQAKKYHDGDGVVQDLPKARELYLRAAQMGSNDAKVNLGYLYFMGEGVGQDYEKARNWYLSAAKNGSKDAQLNLAMIYQNGFGVFKDNNKAKYWRTYGQVYSSNKNPKIKPAIIASVKPADFERSVKLKSTVNQTKANKLSTRDIKPLIATKPKTIIAQINENKLKTKPKPEVTKDLVVTVGEVTQNIPTFLMPMTQAEEKKLDMGNVNSANLKELAVAIPQVQTLTIQAKDGLAGINDTIAALNNDAILPAPIRTLRNRPRLDGKRPQVLSQWISSAIAIIMLAVVIVTSIWFFIQYSTIGNQQKAHVFARAFYAHHRDRLRINYLHYPEKQRKIEEIDDSWAAVLCVLMVKFAQSQKDQETLVGMQSNEIIQALTESPMKAKQAVFPFVKITQRRIFDDIEAHECNFNGEIEEDNNIQMMGVLTPENEQFAEVKLQSVSSEQQTPLLKERTSPDITE